MIAIGLDLGGTKLEAQVFDAGWHAVERRRVPTPRDDYSAFVGEIAGLIHWARATGGSDLPVGISAAGLVNPATGLALTANMPATGHPLPADIERAAGVAVTLINDCRALTLSEAIFGAGRGAHSVAGLILGTGIGGGVAVEGELVRGPATIGGEFGHSYAPAHIVQAHGLPVYCCGCGRMGCMETYVAGPGLSRMARDLTGRDVTPPEIAAGRQSDPALARVWAVWCDMVAELVMNLAMVIDPEVVVLGGGLSQIAHVTDDISAALARARLGDYGVPRVVLAEGGDASGARGAAYAAWQAIQGGAGDV